MVQCNCGPQHCQEHTWFAHKAQARRSPDPRTSRAYDDKGAALARGGRRRERPSPVHPMPAALLNGPKTRRVSGLKGVLTGWFQAKPKGTPPFFGGRPLKHILFICGTVILEGAQKGIWLSISVSEALFTQADERESAGTDVHNLALRSRGGPCCGVPVSSGCSKGPSPRSFL